MRPLGFRTRAKVEARHEEMVRLRKAGLFLKQIGQVLGGLDHSTVHHHLQGDCSCEQEAFQGAVPPWARTLKALRSYGPIRCHALAKITQHDREGVRKHLYAIEEHGLAVREGNLWRALP